ncbi:hypothetical protein F4777DRAFT_304829 [Nemania sp. FL0916]|nr:hypothetical protein F4777DRAFT_304829 [Nemania sp. FL0916]
MLQLFLCSLKLLVTNCTCHLTPESRTRHCVGKKRDNVLVYNRLGRGIIYLRHAHIYSRPSKCRSKYPSLRPSALINLSFCSFIHDRYSPQQQTSIASPVGSNIKK